MRPEWQIALGFILVIFGPRWLIKMGLLITAALSSALYFCIWGGRRVVLKAKRKGQTPCRN